MQIRRETAGKTGIAKGPCAALLSALFLVLVTGSWKATAPQDLTWHTDLGRATQLAQDSGRLLLVVFR